jgi:hypothetical protein
MGMPEVAAKQRAQEDQVLGAQGSIRPVARTAAIKSGVAWMPSRIRAGSPGSTGSEEDRQRYSKDGGNKQNGPSRRNATIATLDGLRRRATAAADNRPRSQFLVNPCFEPDQDFRILEPVVAVGSTQPCTFLERGPRGRPIEPR